MAMVSRVELWLHAPSAVMVNTSADAVAAELRVAGRVVIIDHDRRSAAPRGHDHGASTLVRVRTNLRTGCCDKAIAQGLQLVVRQRDRCDVFHAPTTRTDGVQVFARASRKAVHQ